MLDSYIYKEWFVNLNLSILVLTNSFSMFYFLLSRTYIKQYIWFGKIGQSPCNGNKLVRLHQSKKFNNRKKYSFAFFQNTLTYLKKTMTFKKKGKIAHQIMFLHAKLKAHN